jgi:N-acetylmuramoyl-L-alanine amidase
MKITTNLITPNRYSRPQVKNRGIKGIVLHWVANPKSTALGNKTYFDNLRLQTSSTKNPVYASAHEIIDLNGDIIICVPKDEITYHVGSKTYSKQSLTKFGNSPNYNTYGIECTHIDWDGNFTKETYESMINRCVDLCIEFKLNPLTDIWTHEEVVLWKDCPRYFNRHPNKWKEFKEIVNKKYIDKIKPINKEPIKKEDVVMIEQWKVDILKSLHDEGLVLDFDGWVKKLNDNAPVWLVMALMNNLNNKLKEKASGK